MSIDMRWWHDLGIRKPDFVQHLDLLSPQRPVAMRALTELQIRLIREVGIPLLSDYDGRIPDDAEFHRMLAVRGNYTVEQFIALLERLCRQATRPVSVKLAAQYMGYKDDRPVRRLLQEGILQGEKDHSTGVWQVDLMSCDDYLQRPSVKAKAAKRAA